MTQLVKCPPRKHEDPSSDPQNIYKRPGEVVYCGPGVGEEETEQLASQPGQSVSEPGFDERPCLKQIM